MRGKLSEILMMIAPKIYSKYITVNKKGVTVLYVKTPNAIYGIMNAALLFYKNVLGYLTSIVFYLNTYAPCVANNLITINEMTLVW